MEVVRHVMFAYTGILTEVVRQAVFSFAGMLTEVETKNNLR